MLEHGKRPRETSFLEPGKTHLFKSDVEKAKYQILKGSAAIQEWQRHPDGVEHGTVVDVPIGEVFIAGGGREIALFNNGSDSVGYKKLPELPKLKV